MTSTRPTIGQLAAHSLALDIAPTPRPSAAAVGTFTGMAACSCRGWSSGSVSSNDRQWVDDTVRADHGRHVERMTAADGHGYRISITNDAAQLPVGELVTFQAMASCTCSQWLGAYTGPDRTEVGARAAAAFIDHVDTVKAALPAWTRVWAAVVDTDGVVTTTRPELATRLRAAGLTVTVIGQ